MNKAAFRFALTAALACTGCAAPPPRRAVAPSPALPAGPYPSLEAYCAEPRFDHCEPGLLGSPAGATASGPIQRATLLERGEGGQRSVALAFRTAQGWFVEEALALPVQYDGPYRIHVHLDTLAIDPRGGLDFRFRTVEYGSPEGKLDSDTRGSITCALTAGQARCHQGS